jgi:hypothetical protein
MTFAVMANAIRLRFECWTRCLANKVASIVMMRSSRGIYVSSPIIIPEVYMALNTLAVSISCVKTFIIKKGFQFCLVSNLNKIRTRPSIISVARQVATN